MKGLFSILVFVLSIGSVSHARSGSHLDFLQQIDLKVSAETLVQNREQICSATKVIKQLYPPAQYFSWLAKNESMNPCENSVVDVVRDTAEVMDFLLSYDFNVINKKNSEDAIRIQNFIRSLYSYNVKVRGKLLSEAVEIFDSAIPNGLD